jgi:hypothetical protein
VALRDKVMAAKAADTVIGRLDKPRQGALAAPTAHVPNLPVQQVFDTGPFNTAPAQTQIASPAPAASPSEPAKRVRRTKEQIAADEAKKTATQAGEPVRAPFRPAEGGQPNGSFGIAQGATPGEQMAADIAKLFG